MSPYSVTVNLLDQLNFSVNYGNNRSASSNESEHIRPSVAGL